MLGVGKFYAAKQAIDKGVTSQESKLYLLSLMDGLEKVNELGLLLSIEIRYSLHRNRRKQRSQAMKP